MKRSCNDIISNKWPSLLKNSVVKPSDLGAFEGCISKTDLVTSVAVKGWHNTAFIGAVTFSSMKLIASAITYEEGLLEVKRS